jgi:hypothetical protein
MRGWRRAEPVLMGTVKQPSLLPNAVELLRAEEIDCGTLMSQLTIPADLFCTITSWKPSTQRLFAAA